MLCLRKGRNDPEKLEGVLSVLDRCQYDGGNGGVVFRLGHIPGLQTCAALMSHLATGLPAGGSVGIACEGCLSGSWRVERCCWRWS